MSKIRNHDEDRKKTLTRILCLILAVTMVLSVVAAAVFSRA